MKPNNQALTIKGDCPICGRIMIDDGFSINKHHFVPKARGGKTVEYCHLVCHDMIHRTWSNKELEQEFSDPERIKNDPKMEKFIAWIKRKEPQFYIRSDNRTKARQH